MPTYMFNNYIEVFSTWEAFFGWKQSHEDAPHMPVSSSLSTINDKEENLTTLNTQNDHNN